MEMVLMQNTGCQESSNSFRGFAKLKRSKPEEKSVPHPQSRIRTEGLAEGHQLGAIHGERPAVREAPERPTSCDQGG